MDGTTHSELHSTPQSVLHSTKENDLRTVASTEGEWFVLQGVRTSLPGSSRTAAPSNALICGGQLSTTERGRGSCAWGRSPVGRCQPGQFKGAACAFCGEGRHTARIIMTATSETYDVIVVGGGISGGCITICCVWRFSSGLRRVVWRGNEQMLVAIYRTRQLLLEARSLKCFSLPRCRVKSSLRGLQHALLLMKPSFFVTLVSSRAPLHGHGDAC